MPAAGDAEKLGQGGNRLHRPVAHRGQFVPPGGRCSLLVPGGVGGSPIFVTKMLNEAIGVRLLPLKRFANLEPSCRGDERPVSAGSRRVWVPRVDIGRIRAGP